jgi:predicted DsbA family dithiol-disulfide isomerase
MAVLEIFVHRGCQSEQSAFGLGAQIQEAFPSLQVQVVDDWERARTLGIVALPAFVLDGNLLVIGVPRREWLMRLLRDRMQYEPGSSSSEHSPP